MDNEKNVVEEVEKVEEVPTVPVEESSGNEESLEYLELKSLNEKIDLLQKQQESNSKEMTELLSQMVRYSEISNQNNTDLLATVSETVTTEEIEQASYFSDLAAIVFFVGIVPVVLMWKFGEKIMSAFLRHF